MLVCNAPFSIPYDSKIRDDHSSSFFWYNLNIFLIEAWSILHLILFTQLSKVRSRSVWLLSLWFPLILILPQVETLIFLMILLKGISCADFKFLSCKSEGYILSSWDKIRVPKSYMALISKAINRTVYPLAWWLWIGWLTLLSLNFFLCNDTTYPMGLQK